MLAGFHNCVARSTLFLSPFSLSYQRFKSSVKKCLLIFGIAANIPCVVGDVPRTFPTPFSVAAPDSFCGQPVRTPSRFKIRVSRVRRGSSSSPQNESVTSETASAVGALSSPAAISTENARYSRPSRTPRVPRKKTHPCFHPCSQKPLRLTWLSHLPIKINT
jgi:hypothetical protein